MEEIIKKIQHYLSNINNKKFINRLFLVLIFSVLLLILINGFTSKDEDKESTVINDKDSEYTNVVETEDYSILLENKLTEILEKFQGVDKVHVMVTLEDSSEKIPATDNTKSTETTDEIDSEGGERKIQREDEKTQLLNSSDDIVVLKEIQPNIKGVIVVVEEVEDSLILENIYEAVKTVLGISANKIQVFTNI
ncbi:MAG TPA: sporulation stage III protein AG [Tissierellaceae bacterium]|nr:sporulation stage III protein AG [Tissierellaceae bacterium]